MTANREGAGVSEADTKKVKLPTRTKIAIWWVFIVGALGIVGGIAFYFYLGQHPDAYTEVVMLFVLSVIVWGVVCLLPAIFLLMRRRWSWAVALSLLVLILIILILSNTFAFFIFVPVFYMHYGSIPYITYIIIYAVPLAVVLLDKRNYVAMIKSQAYRDEHIAEAVEP